MTGWWIGKSVDMDGSRRRPPLKTAVLYIMVWCLAQAVDDDSLLKRLIADDPNLPKVSA